MIKAGCGSFGAQVFLAHTVDEAAQRVRAMAGEPVLFQRFIRESAGRDLRLYVVGGRVIAAMERVNLAGDFRANIASGGSANRRGEC
ncbi:Ribosomal protein S6--L-glutamate ligase [bioreactor metagenome]|uniref:Ribosomal protein S6--L-glutamate ligase n=1 Tax=bioreactor metagenome TaxID=1076179 RepID=A0A645HLL1_9ZZZZ